MAKKRASGNGINVSQAIRDALTANPNLSGRECQELVEKQNPGVEFNTKSFQVAYSIIRKKLGLSGGRAKVRRKKPGRKKVARAKAAAPAAATRSAGSGAVSVEQLKLAAEFVAKVGGASAAVSAIEQLSKLQIR